MSKTKAFMISPTNFSTPVCSLILNSSASKNSSEVKKHTSTARKRPIREILGRKRQLRHQSNKATTAEDHALSRMQCIHHTYMALEQLDLPARITRELEITFGPAIAQGTSEIYPLAGCHISPFPNLVTNILDLIVTDIQAEGVKEDVRKFLLSVGVDQSNIDAINHHHANKMETKRIIKKFFQDITGPLREGTVSTFNTTNALHHSVNDVDSRLELLTARTDVTINRLKGLINGTVSISKAMEDTKTQFIKYFSDSIKSLENRKEHLYDLNSIVGRLKKKTVIVTPRLQTKVKKILQRLRTTNEAGIGGFFKLKSPLRRAQIKDITLLNSIQENIENRIPQLSEKLAIIQQELAGTKNFKTVVVGTPIRKEKAKNLISLRASAQKKGQPSLKIQKRLMM